MNEFTPDGEIPESLARDYLPEKLQEECAVFGKEYFRAAGKILLALGALAGAMLNHLATEFFPQASTWIFAIIIVLFIIANRHVRRVEGQWCDDVRRKLGIVKAEPR
jgi:hypothetical protein